MVSNAFVADQAAQTCNIYLIIYICVGNYGSRFQRSYIKSTKNPGFHTFFKILGILLEIYQIQDVKNLVFRNFLIRNSQYFDRNPRFSIEILGISIEVLGFSFEILGTSKNCDNRIPYGLIFIDINIKVTHCYKVIICFECLTNRLGQFFKENDNIIIRGWPIADPLFSQTANGFANLCLEIFQFFIYETLLVVIY